MNSPNNRIQYLDLARGLVIFLVVYHHTILVPEIVSVFYRPFFMPFFFLISGFFFKPLKPKEYFWHKFTTLLVPFLFWRTVFSALDGFKTILSKGLSSTVLKDIVNNYIQGIFAYKSPWMSSLTWFFMCLFVVNILYYIIFQITKTQIQQGVIVLFAASIGIVVNEMVDQTLPLKLVNALIQLPFYFIGTILKKNAEESGLDTFKLKTPLFISVSLCYCILAYLHYILAGKAIISVTNNTYHIYPLFYINAFLGSFIIINFSRIISTRTFISDSKVLKMIKDAGKHSGVIICICAPVTSAIKYLCRKTPFFNEWKYVIAVIISIFVYALVTLLARSIVKTKLAVLFGKKQLRS